MTINTGGLKSTSATINYFVDSVSKYLLGDNEELSKSPTSFVNILADQIGSINAANFYEMLLIKQEAVKSTAKLRKSLVSYLNNIEFKNILGTPASFSFNLGFKTSNLIEYAEPLDNTTEPIYKVTINKDSIIALIDKPVFTFDNNIDIYIRKSLGLNGEIDYNFFAKYDPETGTVYGTVTNPFIKSFTQLVDGEKYFVLNLLLNQYQRNYNYFESLNSSSNKYEFYIPYSNNLHAFEVMYKSSSDEEYTILEGKHDGLINKNGYNFSFVDRTTGTHAVVIKFSRNPEYFSPVNGSSVKIITYTTYGESGNFTINNWNTEVPPIKGIQFNQDVDNKYQYAITKMSPLVSISSGISSGGINEKTIDELRAYVISKSDSKAITLTELEEVAKDHNLRLSKERSDIIEIYYRLSGVVETDNSIIDTTSGLVELDLDKLNYSSLTTTYILSPNTHIKYENEKFHLINNSDKAILSNYITTFNKLNLTLPEREFFFPYFMRIDLSSYVDAKIYDMNVNDVRSMIFEYFNETSTSEASIDYCSVIRNPKEDETTVQTIGDKNYSVIKGCYKFSCNIQIGELIYDQPLEDELIKIYIKLIGKEKTFIINKNNVTITKIDDDNKIINVSANIYTDNGIDIYDRLAIINDSLNIFPRQINDEEIYLMESNIDVSINISFKGTKRSVTSSYDSILTDEDIADGFLGISAIYTLEEVNLLNNITNTIKPIIDIKTSRGERLRYTENIPDTYEETIFEYDENDNIIYVPIEMPNGEIQNFPKILHRRNEIKYDEDNNIIYKHLVGDFMSDSEGNPLYEKEEESIYVEARDFTLIDRIFSEYSSYQTTIDAINLLIKDVESLQKLCPTGSSGKLGVLNTVGSGNYFFINRKTNLEEAIDRLSLSFNIGMKIESDDIDKDILIETVKNAIVTYIQENSTSSSISFMEMLNDIKENNYGIKYFELYSINNYEQGVCHSIYSKESDSNFDIVTMKKNVTVSNDTLTFTPDIKITII